MVAAASDLGACVCEDDATVSELDDLRARVRVQAEQIAALQEATDSWLDGLEQTFASRECSQEDHDSDGQPEGNTCLASTPDDLEFPDDWCLRCYTLMCVREARAALALAEGCAAPAAEAEASWD